MNTEWITDRLPTKEDAREDLSVWVCIGGNVFIGQYNCITLGTPWQPIQVPAPYVMPKIWTLEWDYPGGYWILNNARKQWDSVVIPYITEDQDEVAQQIEDIYNKALP
jgi:hypothetical protein